MPVNPPLVPGNIDLYHRPYVLNPDGSVSTVRSMSFEDNGREVLVPMVSPDGRILNDDEARALYRKTGQHLGQFATPDDATQFAKQLHEDYASGKYDVAGKRFMTVNGTPINMAVSHPQEQDLRQLIRQKLQMR